MSDIPAAGTSAVLFIAKFLMRYTNVFTNQFPNYEINAPPKRAPLSERG